MNAWLAGNCASREWHEPLRWGGAEIVRGRLIWELDSRQRDRDSVLLVITRQDTTRWSCAGLMLAQRCRRWANINPEQNQLCGMAGIAYIQPPPIQPLSFCQQLFAESSAIRHCVDSWNGFDTWQNCTQTGRLTLQRLRDYHSMRDMTYTVINYYIWRLRFLRYIQK